MPRPVTMSDEVHVSEIFSSIQGEGYLAGRRQIFIRLSDCNLDCVYCDTAHDRTGPCRMEKKPGANLFRELPQPVPQKSLIDIVSHWNKILPGAHHSVSFTGGEPLLSISALGALLPAIRKILPVHLETNGTMPVALEQVIQHVDYISMDIKLPSTSGCTENLWDIHHRFLQASVLRKVSVKLVVGNTTSLDEIRRACAIIAGVDSRIPLFLQPLSLPGGLLGISAVNILHLQAFAATLLPDVRVIPQMHKLLGVL